MEFRNNIDLMATPTKGSHVANVDYVDGKQKTISWADYQALSEAEQKDGTLYDIPDMPTAGQGGIITTYTALDQLGLNAPCTVEEIFAAMPNNSYLEIGTDVSEVTNVPDSTAGFLLTIRKYNYARFDIQAKRSSATSLADNKLYLGQLKGEDVSNFSWLPVMTPTYYAGSSTITNTSQIANNGGGGYYVKNGYFHLHVWVKTLGATGTGKVYANLPYAPRGADSFFIHSTATDEWHPPLVATVYRDTSSLTSYIEIKCYETAANVVYDGWISYPIKE